MKGCFRTKPSTRAETHDADLRRSSLTAPGSDGMSPLDQQRERIQDDLRGLIAGEVRCDDVFLQLFASDASIYEIKPLGVVRPRSTADVAACVQYAAEKQLPIHARGAGTGVAGESLGPGLVLDFSAHLHRVIRIDEDRVRVQPGVVHERLNDQLRQHGPAVRPRPGHQQRHHHRQHVAIDAAGSRWLKYGSTRRHVLSLQVVLADGQVLEVGREPLVDGVSTSAIPRKRELVNRLAALLAEHAELIRQHQPKCPVNHCGYHLADVLGDGLSGPGGAAGRLRGHAGPDHRGAAGHRAAAAAPRGGPAAVRQPGEGGAGRARRFCRRARRPAT